MTRTNKNSLHAQSKSATLKKHSRYDAFAFCRGGVLVEVLLALFIFITTSAYLLTASTHSHVLWKTILSKQVSHIEGANKLRLQYTSDNVDQKWEDIAVFGIPILRAPQP